MVRDLHIMYSLEIQDYPQRMWLQRRPKTTPIKLIGRCFPFNLFTWPMQIFMDSIAYFDTASELKKCTQFVQIKLNKSSTVVVEVSSFVFNPVHMRYVRLWKILRVLYLLYSLFIRLFQKVDTWINKEDQTDNQAKQRLDTATQVNCKSDPLSFFDKHFCPIMNL